MTQGDEIVKVDKTPLTKDSAIESASSEEEQMPADDLQGISQTEATEAAEGTQAFSEVMSDVDQVEGPAQVAPVETREIEPTVVEMGPEMESAQKSYMTMMEVRYILGKAYKEVQNLRAR